MKISRHARNNIRLYRISEKEILETIESPDNASEEVDRLISLKRFPGKFSDYPLKVVYREVAGEPFVITAYPLKKKVWR
jgi:hypothetical protein